MWTATEARAMTEDAIKHLDDYYYNEYRADMEKAIMEAVAQGGWEAYIIVTLYGNDPYKAKQREGAVRLAGALSQMYGYKVEVEEGINGISWQDLYITVNWSSDAIDENGGN